MRYAIMAGVLLGCLGMALMCSGYGVLMYYGWIPFVIVLLAASLPAFVRHEWKVSLLCVACMAAIFVSMTGAGMAYRIVRARQICRALDPVLAEAKAIHDRTGRFPTRIADLHSLSSATGVSVGQGRVGDSGISVNEVNLFDATVYLSTNTFHCVVPVTKVLPISFTRFYVYSRGVGDASWRWEKIVWNLGIM